jgi:CRP-like cAMP-binding protein
MDAQSYIFLVRSMTKALDHYDRERVIADSAWFQGIPKSGLDTLVQASYIKHLTAPQYLYQVGETVTSCYCLLSGRLRISMMSEFGQTFAVTDLDPLYWLGDIALLPAETRGIEAKVKVDADILVIPRDAVLELGNKYPILYRNLFIDAGQRRRNIYELMGSMVFYPLRARLAMRVVALLAEHGTERDDGICLGIKLSQNDFASLCMGSRQRVNKVFRGWTEQDILALQGDYYVIYDLPRLKAEINAQGV